MSSNLIIRNSVKSFDLSRCDQLIDEDIENGLTIAQRGNNVLVASEYEDQVYTVPAQLVETVTEQCNIDSVLASRLLYIVARANYTHRNLERMTKLIVKVFNFSINKYGYEPFYSYLDNLADDSVMDLFNEYTFQDAFNELKYQLSSDVPLRRQYN